MREHLTYVSFKLVFTVCLLHGMENGNLFVKEKIKMEIDSPSIAKLEFLIRKVTYFISFVKWPLHRALKRNVI